MTASPFLTRVAARLQQEGDRFMALLDRVNQALAPNEPMEGGDPSPTMMARRSILIGGWLFIILFGIFGLWATLAPIASAAVAPGKIILSGNKKTLQHLEGGVVEEILVHEGEAVHKGQPLIRLNETAARARNDLYRKQYAAAKATEARLLAERDGKATLVFPDAVMQQKDDTEVAAILDSQRRLFISRRDSITSQVDILKQKKKQYTNEIDGLKAQIKASVAQIGYLQEEINAVSTLLRQGNAQKPRLLALQRAQADLKGKRGEYESQIARAEQAIAESDLEIINLQNEFANKVAAEYKENVDKIADLEERMKASEDIMQRIIISAPMSGVITDLQVHTISGVIKPGEKIMDIVPLDELVVEAMVMPQDIDVVEAGQEARVRLTAYKTRNVPPLDGEVLSVSADRFENPNNGQSYYLARVKINETELAEHTEIRLTPGMPADVLIITGERSLVSYLLTPITDSIHKAFREQ